MSLLVYAVGEGGLELVGAHGLDEKPLKGIEHDGLTMFVTEHEAPPVAVTEANLRRYEEVLERLMEHQTVLPARFGTTLDETEASLAVLRERREEFSAGLGGVRGAAELGVQARWVSEDRSRATPSAAGQSHPGTEYLNARLSEQHRISGIDERLRPLRALSRRSRVATLPRPNLAFAAAYLVPHSSVERFVRLAADLDDQLDDVELEVTGPWPPYSFVEGQVA
jgi:hypothetical protein